MDSVSKEFRKNADTCNRLAARLRKHEHQEFARDLAAAWIRLAELAERKAITASGSEVTPAGDARVE